MIWTNFIFSNFVTCKPNTKQLLSPQIRILSYTTLFSAWELPDGCTEQLFICDAAPVTDKRPRSFEATLEAPHPAEPSANVVAFLPHAADNRR